MKKLFVLMLAAAALCAYAVLGTAATVEVPGDMVLAAPEGVTAKQAPVPFSHESHSAVECTSCHHTWDGEGEIQSCMAEGCHDMIEAKSPQDRRDIAFYYNAFHDRMAEPSCVGCHNNLKKAGKGTGPTGCKDCHTGS
ncbi:MAG: cytochrome c3 family protein [Desulfovibrionales bacterium]